MHMTTKSTYVRKKRSTAEVGLSDRSILIKEIRIGKELYSGLIFNIYRKMLVERNCDFLLRNGVIWDII